MSIETLNVTPQTVMGEVSALKAHGWRLVTMTCVDLDEKTLDVLYHFDKDLEMKHLRLTVEKGSTPPSISPIYFAAFLVENEMRDQFGLHFDGLVLDFNGTLYLEEEATRTPFCRYSVVDKLTVKADA